MSTKKTNTGSKYYGITLLGAKPVSIVDEDGDIEYTYRGCTITKEAKYDSGIYGSYKGRIGRGEVSWFWTLAEALQSVDGSLGKVLVEDTDGIIDVTPVISEVKELEPIGSLGLQNLGCVYNAPDNNTYKVNFNFSHTGIKGGTYSR